LEEANPMFKEEILDLDENYRRISRYVLPYDKLINVLMYNSNIKTLSQLEESQLNGEIKLHSVYEQERGNMSDEGKKYVNEEDAQVSNERSPRGRARKNFTIN